MPFIRLAALVLLVACSESTPLEGRGAAIGLTLNASSPDTATVRAARLAIERLNASRPRGAPALALLYPPAGTTGAVQVATFFRDQPAVVGVVGAAGSQEMMDAVEVYEDGEHGGRSALASVSPGATSPALSGRSRWVFRIMPVHTDAARSAARYALDSLQVRSAVVSYQNDSYGVDWKDSFAAEFTRGGGRVLAKLPHLFAGSGPPAALDEWDAYAGYIWKLKPELLVIAGRAPQGRALVQALGGVGASVRILGAEDLGILAEEPERYRGLQYVSYFEPRHPRTAVGREFVALYRQRYGSDPGAHVAHVYDATMLIGRAVQAVGPDRTRVRDYLEALGRTSPAHEGVTGQISFDARHDIPDRPIAIVTIGR